MSVYYAFHLCVGELQMVRPKLSRIAGESSRQVRNKTFQLQVFAWSPLLQHVYGGSFFIRMQLQEEFYKRKHALFVAAMELSVLCDAEVGLVVFGPNGSLHSFCTTDMPAVLLRYGTARQHPHEQCTTQQASEPTVRMLLVAHLPGAG